MAVPTITPLPTAPSRNDSPSVFAQRADAFVAALPPYVTETNDAINWQDLTFTNTDQRATDAANSAQLADDWANKTGSTVDGTEYGAKEYAIGTAVPTGSAKEWSTITGATVDGTEYGAKEYAIGTAVITGSAKEWATATGSLVDGDYSSKEWAAGTIAESAKRWATDAVEISGGLKGARGYAEDSQAASNSSAASANFKGDWSTLTGALNKPASVSHSGSLWTLLNDLADVTVSEPGISGDWKSIYYPSLTGNAGKVLKANTAENALEFGPGIITEYQEFTASGTFTKDANSNWVYIEAIGGGGGGRNGADAQAGGGGGGGAFSARLFRASEVGASETVTIGAGGSGGAPGDSMDGAGGGNTSFGALLTVKGGGPGIAIYGGNGGGGEPSSSFSDIATGGGYSSGAGGSGAEARSGTGGDCIKGGAGGGGAGAGNDRPGGTSQEGGNGGAGNGISGAAGGAGTAPGGGGGASTDNGGGGNGADGRVRVWQW